MPFFAGRPIGEVTREDVRAWFRGLHATPAAANRSAPILSVIMQQAEVWGYRAENSNPCAGIRRYRQGRSERFLTPEEYRRLAAVLGRHEVSRPLHVAAVRLHDLRHTVASQAVARGVPLSTVARMLGHADPRMTLRYAHVGDRDLQAAAERIGKAIEAAMETGESPAAASS